MPRKRVTAKRRTLSYRQWAALLTFGRDIFGDFAERPTEDEIRRAWKMFRERVFEQHAQRRGSLRVMPWGWWKCESPEPRDEAIDEAKQLAAMGIAV